MVRYFIISLFMVLSTGYSGFSQNGFTVGHTETDLSDIPSYWIEKAKEELHIAYNHTSHGSQLVTGMNALMNFPAYGDTYAWVNDSQGDESALSLHDHGIPGIADLSQGDQDYDNNGIDKWAEDTFDFLDNPDNYHINVVMWSWCNIAGHDIDRYLYSMEWLIGLFGEGGTHPRAEEHPVQFVFMTAHANGGGEGDSSDVRNEQIRTHVNTYDRILFDFSDIENYDPDDNYYLDKRVTDALYYDNEEPYDSGPRNGNWAVEYLDAHQYEEIYQLTTGAGVDGYGGCQSCAHSDGPDNLARLNCVLKGKAVWHLFARLAGWDGNSIGTGSLQTGGDQLMLYPNPAKNFVNINIEGGSDKPFTLLVYNLAGQEIYREDSVLSGGKSQIEWDLTGVAEGTYFVQVKMENTVIRSKLQVF